MGPEQNFSFIAKNKEKTNVHNFFKDRFTTRNNIAESTLHYLCKFKLAVQSVASCLGHPILANNVHL